MWKGYHFSIDGIRNGVPLQSTMKYKRVIGVGPRGGASPFKTSLSTTSELTAFRSAIRHSSNWGNGAVVQPCAIWIALSLSMLSGWAIISFGHTQTVDIIKEPLFCLDALLNQLCGTPRDFIFFFRMKLSIIGLIAVDCTKSACA